MQAAIFANDEFQEEKLLAEFVEDAITHWVHIIRARQPDADLMFIASKDDVLRENTVTEKLLKDELKRQMDSIGAPNTSTSASVHDADILFVSCSSLASIRTTRTQIEELIARSDLGIKMPDTYSQALQAIVNIREEAKPLDITKRIGRVFAAVGTLPAALQINAELCRIILQTLHDLGDVLWYENLDIDLFQKTVILDPLLVIDFIRQVVDHRNTRQTMPHADLQAKHYWRGLRDDRRLMEAMKRLLQSFHLVYSAAQDRVMVWDSHLIVPASWQTKTPASWKFLGDILRVKTWRDMSYSERVRVHWEYHPEVLPYYLFDHLVVTSVSLYFKFDAGPDWVLYEGAEGCSACRIMLDRDPRSLCRTIRVEAVVADGARDGHEKKLWANFKHLVGTFVRVLSENSGLAVSCNALDDSGEENNLKELLQSPPPPDQLIPWMPPVEIWGSFILPDM